MNICFHGAVGDVTGSAYHVKTKHASLLVDCGLFQGSRQAEAKNRTLPRLAGGKLDAVVLTHGHLDHAGQKDLLNWFEAVAGSRPRFILTHGEDRARQTLARLIKAQHGIRAECPRLGDVLEV